MVASGLLRPPSKLNLFAYGSNMLLPRIRDRVVTAEVLQTGFISQRKLVFHKRGVDGSAKCNAMFTGCDSDSVWGVVYRISHRDCVVLDRYESVGIGYDREEVDVVIGDTSVRAFAYVAYVTMIDESIKPYNWYHQLVLHGARSHGLPQEYVDHLAQLEAISDPDIERARRHRDLIEAA